MVQHSVGFEKTFLYCFFHNYREYNQEADCFLKTVIDNMAGFIFYQELVNSLIVVIDDMYGFIFYEEIVNGQ